jgi:hypothetical protein
MFYFFLLSYNLAIARSNTDIIVNSVIILFITHLDEQFFDIIFSLSPKWVGTLKYSYDFGIQFKDWSHSDDMMNSMEERGDMERKIDEFQVKDEVDCSYDHPNNLVQTKITNYFGRVRKSEAILVDPPRAMPWMLSISEFSLSAE